MDSMDSKPLFKWAKDWTSILGLSHDLSQDQNYSLGKRTNWTLVRELIEPWLHPEHPISGRASVTVITQAISVHTLKPSPIPIYRVQFQPSLFSLHSYQLISPANHSIVPSKPVTGKQILKPTSRQHLTSSLLSPYCTKVACPLGEWLPPHHQQGPLHLGLHSQATHPPKRYHEKSSATSDPSPIHAFSYTHLSCPGGFCIPSPQHSFWRRSDRLQRSPASSVSTSLWVFLGLFTLGLPTSLFPPLLVGKAVCVQGVHQQICPQVYCGSGSLLSFHTLKGWARLWRQEGFG